MMVASLKKKGAIIFFFSCCCLKDGVWAAPIAARSGSSGSSSNPAYSLSLTTFDPSGRLRQLEFAYAAVEQAWPAAACKCEDGVVVASWFQDVPGSAGGCLHVCRVSETVAMAYAGLKSDFRALAARCQKIAADYRRELDCDASVWYLADELSAVMQQHTQMAGLRPFGAAVILAGSDQVFTVEPSGWAAPFHTTAVGLDARRLRTDIDHTNRTVADVVETLKRFQVSNNEEQRQQSDTTQQRSNLRCSMATIRHKRCRLYADITDYQTE